ncbi:S24 family peptidase [Pseudomonas aeruginosa]|uniref:S24 family peptidase n=1 Tax=Pseudomonas aeruginosa TaxID=287 RepID=UPI00397D89FD
MVHSKSQPLKSTIKHRGPLKVSIGTRQLTGARMYLFAWHGHFFIKRLQVSNKTIEMLSDNKRHKNVRAFLVRVGHLF